MTPILQSENVDFSYADKIIVRNLNLTISAGELIGLIGPSGTGKTTLLRLLSGYLKPQSGRVLNGDRRQDVAALTPLERARLIALVPQELFTPAPYTVGQMVAMGRAAALSRFRNLTSVDRAVVAEALERLEIAALRDRPFGTLSGGEKQRTVIAMALAQQSRIIMLDEPTSALDLGKSQKLLTLLQKLNRETGITVLLVSHDLQLLARHCRRLLLLADGVLQADGAPERILTPAAIQNLFGCQVELRYDSRNHPLICPQT